MSILYVHSLFDIVVDDLWWLSSSFYFLDIFFFLNENQKRKIKLLNYYWECSSSFQELIGCVFFRRRLHNTSPSHMLTFIFACIMHYASGSACWCLCALPTICPLTVSLSLGPSLFRSSLWSARDEQTGKWSQSLPAFKPMKPWTPPGEKPMSNSDFMLSNRSARLKKTQLWSGVLVWVCCLRELMKQDIINQQHPQRPDWDNTSCHNDGKLPVTTFSLSVVTVPQYTAEFHDSTPHALVYIWLALRV